MASNYYFGWKSFSEDEDRPEKPRRFGVTEIRGPDHCLAGHSTTQDVAWIRFEILFLVCLHHHSSVFCFTEIIEDVDLLIRRAERCLEAGADMIMIDADDVCKYADSLRSDVIAKIIGRLGLEKTMFEASSGKTSEWFVKRYGPRVTHLPLSFT
ncbi:hypothetical protein B296_00008434 [Ensete ventricosum]|uniref:Uncharacterized protein n=1 Tax=Ensete ventricosum TaxID=4639 RepID=A0A427BB48_ENSVE|nr:hypothetical protein B296_00008434 [Ensete ventricosum]